MATMSKADEKAIEEFGFEFSEPPPKEHTRRSRYDERWIAARKVCQKFKGRPVKVMQYHQPSSAYTNAKDINNGEHRHFVDNTAEQWGAVAGKDANGEGNDPHAIWLTFNGE